MPIVEGLQLIVSSCIQPFQTGLGLGFKWTVLWHVAIINHIPMGFISNTLLDLRALWSVGPNEMSIRRRISSFSSLFSLENLDNF